MWHDNLENNFFLKKLYKKIPELNDVSISGINIQNEGNKISITFDLPRYADFPPQKWIDSKYNTVIVQIDFFLIHKIFIQATSFDFFRGNIEIYIDTNQLVNVKISGSLKANIVANSGLIQAVSACQIDPTSKE